MIFCCDVALGKKSSKHNIIANNTIIYTSSTNSVIEPNLADAFDAKIISNTYKDGKGIIKFNKKLTRINKDAFFCCTKLTSIILPNSIVHIGDNAFSYCNALTNIKISNNTLKIGNESFSGCTSITKIVIPKKVASIGDYAFAGCTSLKHVISQNINAISGKTVFYNCKLLKNYKQLTQVNNHKR